MGILNVRAEQRRQLIEERKNMQVLKISFKKIVDNLISLKRDIFLECAKFDQIMSSLRSALDPPQIGKFLIWLESVSQQFC